MKKILYILKIIQIPLCIIIGWFIAEILRYYGILRFYGVE